MNDFDFQDLVNLIYCVKRDFRSRTDVELVLRSYLEDGDLPFRYEPERELIESRLGGGK